MTSIIWLDILKSVSLNNKYADWYSSLCQRASNRAASKATAKTRLGYVEIHHVLPAGLGMGGEKSRDNVVYLTAREHFIAHLLLVRMLTGKLRDSMLSAIVIMSGRKLYGCSGRKYESLRKAYSLRMSNLMKGRPISEKQRLAYNLRIGAPLNETQKQAYQMREDRTPARLSYYAKQKGSHHQKPHGRKGGCWTEKQKEAATKRPPLKRAPCQYCHGIFSPSPLSRYHGENCRCRLQL
jgi:hypothetical protein